MQKIRSFAFSLFKSATSLKYYSHIVKAPFSFSLRFFAAFSLLYALIAFSSVWIQYVTPLKPAIGNLLDRVIEILPEDLELTVKNGHAQISQPEPYFIPVNRLEKVLYQIKEDILGATTDNPDYLLVVDTEATIEDFYLYRTFAFLTKDHFAYLDTQDSSSSEQIKVISLTDIDDFVINRQIAEQFINTLRPYLKYILPLVAITLLSFFLFILPLARLLYLLPLTLTTFILTRLYKSQLTYQKLYQINIHLLSITSLTTLLPNLLFHTSPIPFMTSLLLFIASTLIPLHLRNSSHSGTKTKTK